MYPLTKLSAFLLLFILLLLAGCKNGGESSVEIREYTRSEVRMGSAFSVTVISEDSLFANTCLDRAYAEIDRIEKLISSWDANSETSRINKNAGIEPVEVSDELFYLIERSLKVSELTDGAFDISFASMDKIWKFDGTMVAYPAEAEIRRSVEKVNFRDIILDKASKSVFLKNKGMKIGFGAIGKGYAGNKTKNLLVSLGVENGVVNSGGDLIAWGKKANGKPWDVAIADPKNPEQPMSWLEINDMAVVTSGNYERYAMIDGIRYSHIIDPVSGLPVKGIKSVTVLCPDAELADALATGVFVMGRTEGMALINQLNHIEALIITDQDEVLSSKGLSLNYYEND